MASKLSKKIRTDFLVRIFMVVALVVFCSFQPPTKPFGVKTVVIDAGHGGHDPGCLGKRSKEKDVTLGISLKLGRYIEDHFPDVKVLYTRKKDEFVELYERADLANNAKADLFICIHCNSACFFDKAKKKETCSTEIDGVESWVMGLHKSEANLEVAKRENDVILLEKDYVKKYNGFDPNSPEANIIFSLYQNTYLDQSLRMASYVQNEVKARGRAARGVKQAGFMVLFKTSMPSVLIETGFLSNAAEEKFLTSEKGQDALAHAVYNAFKSYKNSIESALTDPVDSKDQEKEENDVNNGKASTKPDTAVKSQEESKNSTREEIKKALPEADNRETVPDEVYWGVQFFTSPKTLPGNHKIFRTMDYVREDFEGGVFKYSTGMLKNKSQAFDLQTKIRKMGYKDAFVVPFCNDKKISLKEANEKIHRKGN